MTEAVSILLGILQRAGQKGLPLVVASRELERQLAENGVHEASLVASASIEQALDDWLVDKVVDDPEGFDIPSARGNVWFLRVLRDEEAKTVRSLPEAERKFLRLLHAVDTDRGLGMMREDVAVAKLRELGFVVNDVPWVEDRLETQYEWEDGKPIKWYCLIPRYLQTEEYRRAVEGMDDKLARRELWFMQQTEEEEREEARASARKKKATKVAGRKKTAKK